MFWCHFCAYFCAYFVPILCLFYAISVLFWLANYKYFRKFCAYFVPTWCLLCAYFVLVCARVCARVCAKFVHILCFFSHQC
jgi:hypothetical protein